MTEKPQPDPKEPISRQQLTEALNRAVEAIASAVQAEISSVRAEISAAEVRTNARIEEAETKLLTEFHRWASPNEARQRTHAAALRAVDLEMEALSDRVAKLEGRQPQ